MGERCTVFVQRGRFVPARQEMPLELSSNKPTTRARMEFLVGFGAILLDLNVPASPARYIVKDDLGGEPRVLPGIVYDDGVLPPIMFPKYIQPWHSLRIADVGQIFDYNNMVWIFTPFAQGLI